MYRPVLLFLGFTTLSTALPQTRPPTSTTTAPYTSPTPFLTTSTTQQNPQEQVIHDIIDTVTCTDPESGTTTTYESHDIDIDSTTAANNNNNNDNINPQFPKEQTHKLSKRGNCLPRTQQQYLDYYEDPPSLDQMLRPTTGGAGGGGNINAPIGIHYSQFENVNRPDAGGAGTGGVGDRRDSHISNIENLVAEPSVERSIGQGVAVNDGNNDNGGDGDGDGDGDGIEEDHDFDLRMDEFGTGLEPDALDFERGIVEVRRGVGGGINGRYGRGGGGRARLLAGRFGDVVHDALEEYAAANRRQDEEEEEKEDTSPSPLQRAHSRPEEPNPINLDDSQYSVIDQETIDEMRRAVMDELASGYGNIGIDIGDYGDGENGAGGNLEGFPDTTDIPLQSVPTGQENEFPSVGEETTRLFWGNGRAPDPDFGWPPRGV